MLGFERLSKEDVQKMEWEAIEGKIVSWNQYMRVVVSCLLPDFKKSLELV
jgi:exocyst complex protein 7